jgi:hypothetical protein
MKKVIIITGKPDAVGPERAALSGRGTDNKTVVLISSENAKVRFEHIDISGGERERGAGLIVTGGSEVTLGPGAVVQNNTSVGIAVEGGTCIIDGGEVLGNGYGGVAVNTGGRFDQTGGNISGNIAPQRSNVSRADGTLGSNF